MGSQNTYWFLKEIEKKENVKATHTYNKYDAGDEKEEDIQTFDETEKLDSISWFIYVFLFFFKRKWSYRKKKM